MDCEHRKYIPGILRMYTEYYWKRFEDIAIIYTACTDIANASLLRPRNGGINHSAQQGKSAAHQRTPALWHQRLLKQLS